MITDVHKVSVVYFSRTGHARKLSQAVRQAIENSVLDAEITVTSIDLSKRYKGLFGIVKAIWDVTRGSQLNLEGAIKPGWENADSFVLISPVWMGRLAAPMARFIALNPILKSRPVGLLLSSHGNKADQAFVQAARLLGKKTHTERLVPQRHQEDLNFVQDIGFFVFDLLNHEMRAKKEGLSV